MEAVYYMSQSGRIYTGDMQRGDRKATKEEIFAHFGDPLENAHAAKIAEIMDGYRAAFAPVENAYPAEERETWPIQLEEARAVFADPQADASVAPMLAIMIEAREKDESLADFAEIVIRNNASYRLLAGSLTGQQQRMFSEVNDLAADEDVTAEDIAAYPVVYVIPESLGYAGI